MAPPPQLYSALYIANATTGLVQGAFVIWFIAVLDRIDAGHWLQIFSMYSVLATCAFVLYTYPTWPRAFHYDQRGICQIMSLSHFWFLLVWLDIFRNTAGLGRASAGSVLMAMLSTISAVLYGMMSLLPPPASSLQPLLDPARSPNALPRHQYQVFAIRMVVAIGWIAMGVLVIGLFLNFGRIDDVVLVVAIVSSAVALCISQLLYFDVNRSTRELLAVMATFQFATCYAQFLFERRQQIPVIAYERAVFITLTIVFFMLLVIRRYDEKRRDNPTPFFVQLAQTCSSKLGGGDEYDDDDDILLEEIPMPPISQSDTKG